MNRRIITMLLALVMALTLTTGVFAAETEANSSAALLLEVIRNEADVAVAVYLQGCDGVTNGRFTVNYDADAVTLTGVQTAAAYAVSSVNDRTAGAVALAWVGSQLTEEKTLMLTLCFQMDPKTAGTTFTVEENGVYAGTEAVETASDTAYTWENPFLDIDGHWAEEEIIKAAKAGLFVGVQNNYFMPNLTVTRGMFVAVLYRMAGEPEMAEIETAFTDVAADAYYAEAVAWAVKTGVTKGMSETSFAPANAISREQMMTMLYRYAKNVDGRDVSGAADLSSFTDGAKVNSWAKDAMAWAVADGLLVGYPDESVQPNTAATRAQVAMILCRYLGL